MKKQTKNAPAVSMQETPAVSVQEVTAQSIEQTKESTNNVAKQSKAKQDEPKQDEPKQDEPKQDAQPKANDGYLTDDEVKHIFAIVKVQESALKVSNILRAYFACLDDATVRKAINYVISKIEPALSVDAGSNYETLKAAKGAYLMAVRAYANYLDKDNKDIVEPKGQGAGYYQFAKVETNGKLLKIFVQDTVNNIYNNRRPMLVDMAAYYVKDGKGYKLTDQKACVVKSDIERAGAAKDAKKQANETEKAKQALEAQGMQVFPAGVNLLNMDDESQNTETMARVKRWLQSHGHDVCTKEEKKMLQALKAQKSNVVS